ncbi:hypothetical protein GGI08_005749 [Coemansia sp. S2]|nr:hypothetical protein GGI08_005749 [Coemansia sp. S2]
MIAAKQSTFDSCNSFQNLIVRHFKLEGVAGSTGDKSDKIGGTVGKPDENELLKRLAISIHKCLFQNRRLSPDCHGTFEKPKHVELEHGDLSFEELESDEFDGLSNESLPMVNPFKERAEKCETISKQLLEIVYKYWGKAMALQKGALEAKSNATISTVPQ